MVPSPCDPTEPVPPPCYRRALAKRGPALHSDALRLVQRSQQQCPPPLPKGPGGAPRVYRAEGLLLIALLRTLWRLGYQEMHDWLVAWPALAWACGLPCGRDGGVRVPSPSQLCKRAAQAGAPPYDLHGGPQGRLQEGGVQMLRPVAQRAVAGDGALHVEPVGLRGVPHRTKAQLQHEQRMLDQELAPVRDLHLLFTELDQQGFDVGRPRMGRRARPGTAGVPLGDDAPVQAGEEGAVALHHGGVLAPVDGQVLGRCASAGYHTNRLLGESVGGISDSAAGARLLSNPTLC